MAGYVLNAEPGAYQISLAPASLIHEGDPTNPAGRRVDSRLASGGHSVSTVDADGNFDVVLEAPLAIGRKAEASVIDVLCEAMRSRGSTVTLVHGAVDSHGEDARVRLDGLEHTLQVVTVPSGPDVWRQLAAHGMTHYEGTLDDSVALLRSALEKKRHSARGAILVLDATHFGAPVSPKLVTAYIEAHGDPVVEYQLADAWLVGSVVRSAFPIRKHDP